MQLCADCREIFGVTHDPAGQFCTDCYLDMMDDDLAWMMDDDDWNDDWDEDETD